VRRAARRRPSAQLTHGPGPACAGAAGADEADPYWTRVWPSAVALAKEVLRRPELVAGKRVCDLGCGLGVAGIAAALAGGRRPARGWCACGVCVCVGGGGGWVGGWGWVGGMAQGPAAARLEPASRHGASSAAAVRPCPGASEVVLMDREPMALQCAALSAAASGVQGVPRPDHLPPSSRLCFSGGDGSLDPFSASSGAGAGGGGEGQERASSGAAAGPSGRFAAAPSCPPPLLHWPAACRSGLRAGATVAWSRGAPPPRRNIQCAGAASERAVLWREIGLQAAGPSSPGPPGEPWPDTATCLMLAQADRAAVRLERAGPQPEV
jgi:hypothetical protein